MKLCILCVTLFLCTSAQAQQVPPRVMMLVRYYDYDPVKLKQFAQDRRDVRKLIKHEWRRDTTMHKLWLLEAHNPDVYRQILERRGL